MIFGDLLSAAGNIVDLQGHGDEEVFNIVIDSRDVSPGDCFVALRGAQFDGHDFIEAAVHAGATSVVMNAAAYSGIKPSVDFALVGDTRAYLPHLAAAFFDHPTKEVPVLGITGTNGKTTTAAIVEEIFVEAGMNPGVFGTLNIRWGEHVVTLPNTTPESLLVHRFARQMVDASVDVIIMEVSSHALETHRVDAVQFHAALFTNLSRDHLDFHGTVEAYFDAKKKLFAEFSPPHRYANVDDEFGKRLCDQGLAQPFGRTGDGYLIRDVELSLDDGSDFVLVSPGGESSAQHITMVGEHNVYNAASALLLSDTVLDEPATLPTYVQVPGRLEEVRTSVFVDYAHTPDALGHALMTLRTLTDARVIVVFGCGGDRDPGKRPIMGRVASEFADVVIVTSDNPRTEDPDAIIDEIVEGIDGEFLRDVDRKNAIHDALSKQEVGDVVLIAGKGHESYQEINGVRFPFRDADVVERFYA